MLLTAMGIKKPKGNGINDSLGDYFLNCVK
jgi:hypothetical protein